MKIFKSKIISKMLFAATILWTAAALVPVCAFASLADGTSWEQFHGDATNVGYSASSAPDTAEFLWESADIGVNGSSSVVVADGKVFAFSAPSDMYGGDSALSCLNELTGATIWTTTLLPSEWGSWSSPAYHNGKVFVSSGPETRCLNASDGAQIWTFTNPSGNASCNGGPTVADGKVFCSDWDGGHYYCLNEDTGALLWTFNVSGYAQGTAAYENGYLYLTSWLYVGGHVYCVDAVSGNLVWHVTTNLDACGSAAVADGSVYVTTYNFSGDGELYSLDASDGSTNWVKIVQRTDSTPAVAYGNVYVCGGCTGYSYSQTYCFTTGGTLVWETSTAFGVGNWTCSVAVADGKVFVGKPDPVTYFCYSGIYALDAYTGAEVWHYDAGGSSPAVANGRVFTPHGADGKVYAFGPAYPDWDVNQDGNINVLDMVLIGQHWGETGSPGWIREDINQDGSVNVLDMVLIGQHWGE